MSNYTPTPIVPNWAGEFSSYQQWVNKGKSWLASPDHRRAVCIDDKGRRVTCGADFMLARDEDAFPVRFFWDCEPQASTLGPSPDEKLVAALQEILTLSSPAIMQAAARAGLAAAGVEVK